MTSSSRILAFSAQISPLLNLKKKLLGPILVDWDPVIISKIRGEYFKLVVKAVESRSMDRLFVEACNPTVTDRCLRDKMGSSQLEWQLGCRVMGQSPKKVSYEYLG